MHRSHGPPCTGCHRRLWLVCCSNRWGAELLMAPADMLVFTLRRRRLWRPARVLRGSSKASLSTLVCMQRLPRVGAALGSRVQAARHLLGSLGGPALVLGFAVLPVLLSTRLHCRAALCGCTACLAPACCLPAGTVRHADRRRPSGYALLCRPRCCCCRAVKLRSRACSRSLRVQLPRVSVLGHPEGFQRASLLLMAACRLGAGCGWWQGLPASRSVQSVQARLLVGAQGLLLALGSCPGAAGCKTLQLHALLAQHRLCTVLMLRLSGRQPARLVLFACLWQPVRGMPALSWHVPGAQSAECWRWQLVT